MMKSIKKSKIRIHPPGSAQGVTKLDISKLGRPYHKVPKIFTDCFDILDARISIYFLKKYRINVALNNLKFEIDFMQKHTLIYSNSIGKTGFDIDRSLLLDILNDYYGLNNESSQQKESEAESQVTKTEERLKAKLGSELTRLVLCHELFADDLKIKQDYSSVITHWGYRITFILEGYEGGNFYLFLDSQHVDRLFATLRQASLEELPQREPISPKQLETMINNLPVKLTACLAKITMPLSQLALLKQGDILPFSMPDRCPLSVGQENLFSAVIAEERGKLFFAEFNDKMSESNNHA